MLYVQGFARIERISATRITRAKNLMFCLLIFLITLLPKFQTPPAVRLSILPPVCQSLKLLTLAMNSNHRIEKRRMGLLIALRSLGQCDKIFQEEGNLGM